MKIEIDLDDVFRDEDGVPEETVQEAVKRQVIARLTDDYRKRLFTRFDDQMAKIMQEQIQEVMKDRMPSIVDDIMNAEFTPVGTYGQRSEPTTFRAELVKAVSANCTYSPRNYSSEENAFTKAVKAVVAEQLAAFKAEFTAKIDDTFKRDALAFAVAKLSERLGLSK